MSFSIKARINGGTTMNKNVKKEFDKQVKQINHELSRVMDLVNENIPKDLIKLEFDSIRVLVDYCEKLAVEGQSAIEKWMRK